MTNILLAEIVRLIHILVIIFIVIVPFLELPSLWSIHIALCLTLIVHWLFNNDACFLTLVESSLRGVEHSKTFIHSLVSPFYMVSEYSFSKLIWTGTIILMSISLYRFSGFIISKIPHLNKKI